jgi:hypothetical protein
MQPSKRRYLKIKLEIATPLMKDVEALAQSERTTVSSLVERGLRLVLAARRRCQPFKLRDSSAGGNGLHPDAVGRPWHELLARSYGRSRQ